MGKRGMGDFTDLECDVKAWISKIKHLSDC